MTVQSIFLMSQRLLMMIRAAALTEKAAVVVALSRSSNLIIWARLALILVICSMYCLDAGDSGPAPGNKQNYKPAFLKPAIIPEMILNHPYLWKNQFQEISEKVTDPSAFGCGWGVSLNRKKPVKTLCIFKNSFSLLLIPIYPCLKLNEPEYETSNGLKSTNLDQNQNFKISRCQFHMFE